jgi:hypothetical protein
MKKQKRIILLFFIFILILFIAILLIIFNSNSLTGNAITNPSITGKDIYDFEEDSRTKEILKNISNKYEIENFHWNHFPLTYIFKSSCSQDQINKVKQSFNLIQSETNNLIQFSEIQNFDSPDLSIFCHNTELSNIGITEGKTQYTLKKDLRNKSQNIISNATLHFYNHLDCGNYPDLEIHEILHLLGFKHINKPDSIMYPLNNKCDSEGIDKEILLILQRTYSS